MNFQENSASGQSCFKGKEGATDGEKVTVEITTVNNADQSTQNFDCDESEKLLLPNISLKSHSLLHTTRKDFVCTFCGKFYRCRSALAQHMIMHSSIRPFKCKVCGKSYKRKQVLQRHSFIHSNSRVSSFKNNISQQKMCKRSSSVGGKVLTRCNNLKNRSLATATRKNLRSEVSKMSFSKTEKITKHMKVHFDTQESKKFGCKLCGEIFSNKKNLEEHLVIHSGKETFCTQHDGKKYPLGRKLGGKSSKQRLKLRKDLSIHSEKNFECRTCGESFATKLGMKIHWARLHKNAVKKLKREVGGELFAQEEVMKRHSSIHSEKNFKCKTCGRSFSNARGLKIHSAHHRVNPVRKFNSEVGGKLIEQKKVVQKHSFKQSNKKFKCQECGETFHSGRGLKIHLARLHGNSVLEFRCEICGVIYTEKSELDSHYYSHPRSGELVRVDRKEPFMREEKVREHSKVHHEEKCFQCDGCGRKFNTKRGLMVHSYGHCTAALEKLSQCKVCGKSFPQKEKLQEHLLIHSGEGFKCKACGKIFAKEMSLKMHSLSSHNSATKGFKCPVCGKSFRKKVNFEKHSFIHSEKKFKCDGFSKSFPTQHHSKIHSTRCHDNAVTKFEWEDHGVQFSQKKELKTHLQRHPCFEELGQEVSEQSFLQNQGTKEHNLTLHSNFHDNAAPKEFECEVCGELFTEEAQLKTHFRSHPRVEDIRRELYEESQRTNEKMSNTAKFEEDCLEVYVY